MSKPARPDEAAISFDIMRAGLAGLLAGRKSRAIKVTQRQRERAYGALVRVALTVDGTVHFSLEEPEPDMRTGVVYLGPDHPTAALPDSEHRRSER